jgi:hypothetical protein
VKNIKNQEKKEIIEEFSQQAVRLVSLTEPMKNIFQTSIPNLPTVKVIFNSADVSTTSNYSLRFKLVNFYIFIIIFCFYIANWFFSLRLFLHINFFVVFFFICKFFIFHRIGPIFLFFLYRIACIIKFFLFAYLNKFDFFIL